jgi:hypothetical protein
VAFIETDAARIQMANQIRELRAEGLRRLAQVDEIMARIRALQLSMQENSESFSKEDVAEVDAIVEEIHGQVSDAAQKALPAKLEPALPVEVVAAAVP